MVAEEETLAAAAQEKEEVVVEEEMAAVVARVEEMHLEAEVGLVTAVLVTAPAGMEEEEAEAMVVAAEVEVLTDNPLRAPFPPLLQTTPGR